MRPSHHFDWEESTFEMNRITLLRWGVKLFDERLKAEAVPVVSDSTHTSWTQPCQQSSGDAGTPKLLPPGLLLCHRNSSAYCPPLILLNLRITLCLGSRCWDGLCSSYTHTNVFLPTYFPNLGKSEHTSHFGKHRLSSSSPYSHVKMTN